jgi:hypothetical protein
MEHTSQEARQADDNPEHLGGEIAASVYYSNHNLREMFSRENAERRRGGGKMLRKLLTSAQDKKCMSQMVKIRAQYDVSNNDDVILAWIKMQVEAGKQEGIHADLLDVAAKVAIPERVVEWNDEAGH